MVEILRRRAPQNDTQLRTLADLKYGGYLAFECLPLPDSRTAAVDALAYVHAIKT